MLQIQWDQSFYNTRVCHGNIILDRNIKDGSWIQAALDRLNIVSRDVTCILYICDMHNARDISQQSLMSANPEFPIILSVIAKTRRHAFVGRSHHKICRRSSQCILPL